LLREHRGLDEPPLDSGYRVMGLLTQLKYRYEVQRAIDLLEHFDGEARENVLFGLGWGLEYQYEKDGDWPALTAGIARCVRADDRAAALRGARWAVLKREEQSRTYANAGFRPEYYRALHARISQLAARMVTLTAPRS
jgi:hypothetical protein